MILNKMEISQHFETGEQEEIAQKNICNDSCVWNETSTPCHEIVFYGYPSEPYLQYLSKLKVHSLTITGSLNWDDILLLSTMEVYNLSIRTERYHHIHSLTNLAKSKHLRKLIINDCVAFELVDLASSKTLKSLYLENCGHLCNTFFNNIVENKTLKELTLYNCDVTDRETQVLAKNKSLTSLGLQYNYVKDNGAIALSRNTSLKYLNLEHNSIGYEGKLAFQNNRTLHSLNLLVPNGNYQIYNLNGQAHMKNYTSHLSRKNYKKYILKIKKMLSEYFIEDIVNLIISTIKWEDCTTDTNLRRSKRLKL